MGQYDLPHGFIMTGMERYNGEHLGRNPHIVVLGSCKVGNFVVSTPVLRGLRARFPDAVIGFIGSEVTADFERALPCLDWRCRVATAADPRRKASTPWACAACAQPRWF